MSCGELRCEPVPEETWEKKNKFGLKKDKQASGGVETKGLCKK